MPILVPTGSSPSLADFTSRVRTDLFDAGQRAGEQPRWADSDLQRALDRANDKYSSAAPYLKQILTQTFPGARRYAVPADAWFVDQVEYPYGAWPTWLQPFEELLSPLISAPVVSPAAAVSFSNTGNTDLNPGAYSWYVSFVTPGGETTAVLFQTATAAPGSYHQALLSNLPIGPYGVTARNLYRTAAGGTGATLVTQIQDNTTHLPRLRLRRLHRRGRSHARRQHHPGRPLRRPPDRRLQAAQLLQRTRSRSELGLAPHPVRRQARARRQRHHHPRTPL